VTTQCAPCGQGRLAWPAPAHFTIVVVVDDPKAGAATASTTPNVISTKASFLMTAALPTVVQSPRPASLLGERARLRQSLEFPTSLRWSYRTSPSRPARPVQPRSRPKTHRGPSYLHCSSGGIRGMCSPGTVGAAGSSRTELRLRLPERCAWSTVVRGKSGRGLAVRRAGSSGTCPIAQADRAARRTDKEQARGARPINAHRIPSRAADQERLGGVGA
jgi:hypothetical protein